MVLYVLPMQVRAQPDFADELVVHGVYYVMVKSLVSMLSFPTPPIKRTV
jgi:hypothetical protein